MLSISRDASKVAVNLDMFFLLLFIVMQSPFSNMPNSNCLSCSQCHQATRGSGESGLFSRLRVSYWRMKSSAWMNFDLASHCGRRPELWSAKGLEPSWCAPQTEPKLLSKEAATSRQGNEQGKAPGIETAKINVGGLAVWGGGVGYFASGLSVCILSTCLDRDAHGECQKQSCHQSCTWLYG